VGYVVERDVYLSVALAWVFAALFGGVPFLIEGTFESLLDSTFEAMSGFTTTGATLLSDIEAQTPSILFWRSMTQWLRGIGIVVLFVAVAPVVGVGAARLLRAEVSGLTQTRLTPRIADAAKALVVIYLAISLAETVCLLVAGMPLYDAVVHTFGTVATGGFSSKTASIGFYDSLAIEMVIHSLHDGLGGLLLRLLPLLRPTPLRRAARSGAACVPAPPCGRDALRVDGADLAGDLRGFLGSGVTGLSLLRL
jgi:trk system potassium uptake protein